MIVDHNGQAHRLLDVWPSVIKSFSLFSVKSDVYLMELIWWLHELL